MPTISEFYGIKIAMYNDEHNPPHFHAWYTGNDVTVDIYTGEVLKGNIPKRGQRMLKDWCALHKDELLENWERAEKRQVLFTIDPLK